MITSSPLATFVAPLLFLVLAAAPAAAQQQQPPQQPAQRPAAGVVPANHSGVAIIDFPYILKNHAGFQARMEALRREAEGVENKIKAERDAIQKLAQKLEDYAKGSKEYKDLEEDLTKRQANMGVEFNIAKKKFQEAEAQVYYQVYQEVLSHVKYYAENNGIQLVLKFNGDEADKDNPDEVAREVGKLVLYYNHAIDITPMILGQLKSNQQPRAAAAPNPAARTGVPPRTR